MQLVALECPRSSGVFDRVALESFLQLLLTKCFIELLYNVPRGRSGVLNDAAIDGTNYLLWSVHVKCSGVFTQPLKCVQIAFSGVLKQHPLSSYFSCDLTLIEPPWSVVVTSTELLRVNSQETRRAALESHYKLHWMFP
jgi:hypothetical protein